MDTWRSFLVEWGEFRNMHGWMGNEGDFQGLFNEWNISKNPGYIAPRQVAAI